LTVLNPKLPKSTVPAIEIDEGLKGIKASQQKHREHLLEEKKALSPGGSLHIT
jgi:hypothetical protein